LLSASEDIQVVGEARDGREAVALLAGHSPDVVLMDLDMDNLNGIDAARQMLEKRPDQRILILTMHSEEEYLIAVLEAGVTGYLTKNVAHTELAEAIRVVASGELYVSASAARVLAQKIRKPDTHATERALFDGLTEREQDVLRFTAQGFTAPEIGEKLFISPKTVDTYKHRLREKMGLAHRSDYVRMALRLDILRN
jgi:DNA-binding NarL/FixJ family response regulator